MLGCLAMLRRWRSSSKYDVGSSAAAIILCLSSVLSLPERLTLVCLVLTFVCLVLLYTRGNSLVCVWLKLGYQETKLLTKTLDVLKIIYGREKYISQPTKITFVRELAGKLKSQEFCFVCLCLFFIY